MAWGFGAAGRRNPRNAKAAVTPERLPDSRESTGDPTGVRRDRDVADAIAGFQGCDRHKHGRGDGGFPRGARSRVLARRTLKG